MPFAVVYENYADGAVFSGGSYSLSLENLKNDDIHRVARSSSLDPAATQFTVNLGAQRPVGAVILGPLNIAPGATFRIRSFADQDMTEPLYDSSVITVGGTVIDWSDLSQWFEWEDNNFWEGVPQPDLPELPRYAIGTIPAEVAGQGLAQFWLVEINDPSNPSGYVDMGRLLMGRIFRPSLNYAPESNELSFSMLTDVTESLGGRRTYWFRGMRRLFRCSFPMGPENEAFEDWLRLAVRARTDKQIFVIPEETDDVDYLQRRAFLATLRQPPAIVQVLVERASVVFDAEEVI
jgi:hypothetical protein